ncbi:hypothetical protein LPJ81_002893 [Coemansia sp. IMI 209127]|nr:hypothetical protein LPJ81_002893 [Coemansia sp. IMI 209127]
MYATLMDERGERELNTLNDKKARTMTGSVVASLAHLKDVDGNDGAFFVFPDLSVRCEGVYKLKFSLFEIVGNQVFFCKSITSEMFTVYSAKKFPGMEESTRLTKLFAEQGLKIRVRKEQKSSRPKGARSRPIATAHHSDRNSPVPAQQQQQHHMPSWAVVEHHRSATTGSIGYPAGAARHADHTQRPVQQYSGTPMSVVSPPVGPTNPGGPASRQTPSNSNTWGAMQPHSAGITPGRAGLSHSPPPQPHQSVSQYVDHADAQANPDSDAAGYSQYRHFPQHHHPHQQHSHQYQAQHHRAANNPSPGSQSQYHSHQQTTASYSHMVTSTLSSPAAASGSAPSRHELHPIQTSGLTPQQPQYQPHQQQHIFGGQQAHGNQRMADQHPSYTSEPISAHEHGEYADHPMYRSLPQTLPSSSQPQPPYRQQQQQPQQQRHYYPPQRPWSPHHRAQHHYSPTHPSHAFTSDPRYSPYNRQVDGPRDGRQHASSSSSSSGVRLNNLAGPSSAESGITSPPEPQHSLRHQTHGAPRTGMARKSSPDPMHRYQKSPVHQQKHVYPSMVTADSAPSATLPPIGQNQAGGSGLGRHSQPRQQQQQQPGSQKQQFVNSPSPETRPNLPPFGAMHARTLESASGGEAPAVRETLSPAPQHRMMAVHSLLISDSSSPERTNGSSS